MAGLNQECVITDIVYYIGRSYSDDLQEKTKVKIENLQGAIIFDIPNVFLYEILIFSV